MKDRLEFIKQRRNWLVKSRELEKEFAKSCKGDGFTIKEISEIMEIPESSVLYLVK